MVYINPKSLGFGRSISKAKSLPLGGYFCITKVLSSISAGKFETTLSLNWEASGTEKKEEPLIYNDPRNSLVHNKDFGAPPLDGMPARND